MQNQALHRRNTQSGNALWYILIAIALLVGLTYALMRNSSKMASNLGDDEARIVAAQIMRSLTDLHDGVAKLSLMNGCPDTQISFDNTFDTTNYVNASAPSDKHCHVFDVAGAGLSRELVPASASSTYAGLGWSIDGTRSVNGVGPENATQTVCASNCAELIASATGIDAAVCREYNLLAKIPDGTIATESDTAPIGTYFTGTYGAGNTNPTRISTGTGLSTTALYGVKTGCFMVSGSPDVYQIYYVLLAR